MLMGLFGAALFYGDGLITPAISVLSAVEGLEVATPRSSPSSSRSRCVVLVGLFVVQKRGTGSVGALFGPIMIVWFATLALLGVDRHRCGRPRSWRRSIRCTRSGSWPRTARSGSFRWARSCSS